MIKRLLFVLLAAALGGAALAKLPPVVQDDAAKAKAAEAAAKTAWQAKVDAWQLCKVQDRLAAKFGDKGGSAVKTVAAKPSAPAPAAAASKPALGATTPVPVGGAAPPACADPGPYTYNAPSQTPLETSGAHSPAGNATSPPSVKQESATMAPAKKP